MRPGGDCGQYVEQRRRLPVTITRDRSGTPLPRWAHQHMQMIASDLSDHPSRSLGLVFLVRIERGEPQIPTGCVRPDPWPRHALLVEAEPPTPHVVDDMLHAVRLARE